jgi:hypothetical protein
VEPIILHAGEFSFACDPQLILAMIVPASHVIACYGYLSCNNLKAMSMFTGTRLYSVDRAQSRTLSLPRDGVRSGHGRSGL